MIVVDSNVLLYAVGADHPVREPSRRLIEAIRAGTLVATTTIYVIQEFTHVAARRRPRRDAVELARRYAALFRPLLLPTEDDLGIALDLFARHERLDAFDVLLAASALANDAEALVSADTAFGSVPRLRHVIPGTPEFDRLLAA